MKEKIVVRKLMQIHNFFGLNENLVDKTGYKFTKAEILDALIKELGVLNVVKWTPYTKEQIIKKEFRYNDILKFCGVNTLYDKKTGEPYHFLYVDGFYRELQTAFDEILIYKIKNEELAYMMIKSLELWANSDEKDVERIKTYQWGVLV